MKTTFRANLQVHGVPMEYEEACERIYGEPYGEWKKKHQKTLEAVLMVMSMGSRDRFTVQKKSRFHALSR